MEAPRTVKRMQMRSDWLGAETIEAQRLTLEPLRVDHADEMVVVLGDPNVYAYTGGEPPSAKELISARCWHGSGDSPRHAGRHVRWAGVDRLPHQRELRGASGCGRRTQSGCRRKPNDHRPLGWPWETSAIRLGLSPTVRYVFSKVAASDGRGPGDADA